ncbi:MAG: hypothetical protein ACXVWU_10725 [Nocardioides sp.]
MSENTQRVIVHVGVPKSGTTFLQSSLAQNRVELAEHGVLYPSDGTDLMFRAALDVRGNHQTWGRSRDGVTGAWDEVCRRAREFAGTTVISHEVLGGAGRRQVDAALSTLDGLEVHVVATARDLARQVTAEWQEGVKHGRSIGFEQFAGRVLDGDGDNEHARRFSAAQDLPEVLHRWGAGLPPERVHVVCCPEPGGDPTELWQLFAGLVGFDAAAFDPAGDRANSSLGVEQIHLLRSVNAALDSRLRQPGYGRLVKRWFTGQLLTGHPSPRPRMPLERYDDLAVVGERWVKEIDQAGWTVHGDVRRLVSRAPAQQAPHPDDTDLRAEVATATALLAELLLELHSSQTRVEELLEERRHLKKKRKKLKRRLAEALDGASD